MGNGRERGKGRRGREWDGVMKRRKERGGKGREGSKRDWQIERAEGRGEGGERRRPYRLHF